MAHQHDKTFAAQMGGRTMNEDKDKHLAEEKPTFAQRLQRSQEDAIEATVVAKTFGVGTQENPPPKEDPIQAQIVTAAFGQMNNIIDKSHQSDKDKEVALSKAREETTTAKTDLYNTQMAQLHLMQQTFADALQKAQTNNSPKAAMEAISAYQEMVEKLTPKPANDGNMAVNRNMDSSLALQIEKMRQDHELEMKRFDKSITDQNNTFSLQMLQFQEDSRRRWREYEDGKEMKESAMSGFGDIAGALGAGITRERGESRRDDEVIQASVGSFPCEFCGTKVLVNPGESTVSCPKPECGASYNIQRK